MKTIYQMDEFENLDELPDDAVVVLDDRSFKYDFVKDRIVYPGEPGYEDLPELDRL